MTVKNDFKNDALKEDLVRDVVLRDAIYIYAQALDNSGETDYWCASNSEVYKLSKYSDPEAVVFREFIDDVQTNGRHWPIIAGNLQCRVTWKGNCLITVKPMTLDEAGRLSPVLLFLNIYKNQRRDVINVLETLSNITGREISDDDDNGINHLERVLNWPRWRIFLHIAIYSRRVRND